MKKNTLMVLVLTGLIAGCASETGISGSKVRGSVTQGTIYEMPSKKTPASPLDYRIVENTKAFLRALPETSNQPTAFESRSDTLPKESRTQIINDGRIRVGLLLPFESSNETVNEVATDLFNAAQLAVFDVNRPEITLIVKPTNGTKKGAVRAARAALNEGVQIIIGPVFADSVRAVTPIAKSANIPLIAFSNDRSVAHQGVWLIGFLPEQNLERIIETARLEGKERFAALIPETPYGQRIAAALEPTVTRYGGELVQVEYYQEEAQSMFDPVQKLAQYDDRKLAKEEEMARLMEEARLLLPNTEEEEFEKALAEKAPELFAQIQELERRETFGELPFDAVILPEGGVKLRSLAPLLPYFDVDPREVKFLGTGLWDDPQLGQEPPLVGGWYAAPDPGGWKAFSGRYKKVYGQKPRRIASLAYDAVSLTAALSAINPDNPFNDTAMTNADGFLGIDGIFRLNEDGLNERGLAVLEVRRRKNKIVTQA
ncbi:MAG: penicillin-binding protein activator, partial [Candidatus Micropelagos thuwalensis]